MVVVGGMGGGGAQCNNKQNRKQKQNKQKSGESFFRKKNWLGRSLTRKVTVSTDHELTLCLSKCTFGRSYAYQNVHLADLMLIKMYIWQILC